MSFAATTISPTPRGRRRSIDALGWETPVWAHIPLIHGPDGAKLSKRHGALGVDAYRAMGYLPEALRNYLVRLGWSHGDKEMFTQDEMIAAFDLGAVGRSASRFDFARLENMNGHFMRASDDAALFEQFLKTLPYLPGGPEMAAALDEGKRRNFAPPFRACASAPRPWRSWSTARNICSPIARWRWTPRPRTSSPGRPAASEGAAAGADRRLGLERGGDRSGGARLWRADRRQARDGGAAVARGADRPHDIAWAFSTC